MTPDTVFVISIVVTVIIGSGAFGAWLAERGR